MKKIIEDLKQVLFFFTRKFRSPYNEEYNSINYIYKEKLKMKKFVVIVSMMVLVFSLYKLTGFAFADCDATDETYIAEDVTVKQDTLAAIQHVIEDGFTKFEGHVKEYHVYKSIFNKKYHVIFDVDVEYNYDGEFYYIAKIDPNNGNYDYEWELKPIDNWIETSTFDIVNFLNVTIV